jgi:two-component system response regulator DevR
MTVAARPPIRVLLIDDSEIFRRGVSAVFATSAEPPIHVVGEAGSVAGGVADCMRLKPQVVLLDVRLPDGDGFNACRQILAQRPETRVVMLTTHASDELIYDAVTAGAHGYLKKEIAALSLIHAVRDVASGRSILDPDATTRVLRLLRRGNAGATGPDLAVLSGQERRVLSLVAEGLTNKQAGAKLGLSENTVKNYLVNVFEKLQVKRRAHAAAIYIQQSAAALRPPRNR